MSTKQGQSEVTTIVVKFKITNSIQGICIFKF